MAMAPATSRAAKAWALYRSQCCSPAANRIVLYIRTSSCSPSAGQCVPDNGKMLDMLLYSPPLYRCDTGTLSLWIQRANLMPKELFLKNPVYITEFCSFYSGEERLSDRWSATGMLEKAEPRDRVYTWEVCQDETV